MKRTSACYRRSITLAAITKLVACAAVYAVYFMSRLCVLFRCMWRRGQRKAINWDSTEWMKLRTGNIRVLQKYFWLFWGDSRERNRQTCSFNVLKCIFNSHAQIANFSQVHLSLCVSVCIRDWIKRIRLFKINNTYCYCFETTHGRDIKSTINALLNWW